MVKRALKLLLFIFLVFVSVLSWNTLMFTTRQKEAKVQSTPPLPPTALRHFQQLLQFKTVSYDDSSLLDTTQFIGLQKFLERAYPYVHQKLTKEVINDYSLLYHWIGRDTTLKPAILMAHIDVVPIEPASRSLWKVDPFAGEIKDGYIWGRGTIDNKINVVSILETVEKLVRENFQPQRSVYLVFGHDEEIAGPNGAEAIARLLQARKVTAEFVLDEGGIITQEKIPGLTTPVALLGTSEKGFLSVSLSVKKEGGHSSMPEEDTAVDILLEAIRKIRLHPAAAKFAPATEDFIDYLGPELPLGKKLVFANAWLFKPLIIKAYEKTAAGNAIMRTTVVPTIVTAGVKENVVPSVATATINLRLLPGDSIKQEIRRIEKLVDDERVHIVLKRGTEASPATSTQSWGYQKVEETVRNTFPQTLAVPFLLIGGTDSRHFRQVTQASIRFSPVTDPIGFHGVNERVSLESYRTALWFYEQLIRGI
jgi:carboxypeptidase PM20D1